MNNYKTYFAIEKKLHLQGVHFERSEIIADFTNGQKNSLKQLTDWEYNELIRRLNSTMSQQLPKYDVNNPLQKQRRKVIALLCKVGMLKNDTADMPRIYAWVRQYGYLHKNFNDYTYEEIPKLVTQAEKFYKSHIERL